MGSKAPSWSEKWTYDYEEDDWKLEKTKSSNNTGKKMAEVKAAASAGLDKAKAAAAVGAQKMKSGTSDGIKWLKKKCSSK